MPVTVQLPGYNHAAPAVGLAQVIGAGFGAYKDYNQAQTAKAQAAQEQAQTQGLQQDTAEKKRQIDIATATQKASIDPNSQISAEKRQSVALGLQALHDTGIIKTPAAESEFMKSMNMLTQPNPDTGQLMNAVQVDNFMTNSPLNDLAKGQQSIEAAKFNGGYKQQIAKTAAEKLEETKNQNAVSAGHAYESDPIIKQSKISANSLQRGLSILNNPNKPVTTKDLNLAWTDYINGVAAGGAATEGKIGRELPETWAQQWNELQQKAGVNDDLRKTPGGAQLINLLKENINTVQGDISNQIGDQAANIHTNYSQSTNPKVVETSKQKLKQYAPKKYGELYGGKPASVSSGPMSFEEFMKAKK